MDWYVSEDEVRGAIEGRLNRTITDMEWGAITDIILYEVKGPFFLKDEDLDYDMKRIRELLEFGKEAKS